MDNYNNGLPSVGYAEVKKKLKILKAIAVILTVLHCLSCVLLAVFFLVLAPNIAPEFAPELGDEYWATLFSFSSVFFGVMLFIDCAVTVTVIWLLHHALKKRIEQGRPILSVVAVIGVAWFLPKAFAAIGNLVTTLIENNLNYIL